MTQKDFNALRSGDTVMHKWYGLSTVQMHIAGHGICMVPDTSEGMALLRQHSGTRNPMIIEKNHRLVQPQKTT